MTIAKMLKINILGINKHKKKILKLIKDTGVVHLVFEKSEKEKTNKKIEENIKKEIEFKKILLELNKEKKNKTQKKIHNKEIEKEIKKIDNILKTIENNKKIIENKQKIQNVLKKIGNINKENIEILKDKKINIKIFKIEKKKWINVKKELINYKIIKNEEKEIFILTINSSTVNNELEELNDLLYNDLKTIDFYIKKKKIETLMLKNKIKKYCLFKDKLEKAIIKLKDKIIIEEIQEKINKINNDFFLIKGFIPEENKKNIIEKFIKKPINISFEKISNSEEAPIKLKNNYIFEGFEFIVKAFSGISYLEKDLTPLIGILFIIFGSMCLLDAGYSLLLIFFGLLLIKKKIQIGKIFLITGIISTVVGLLVGQVFGLIMGKDFLYGKIPILDFSTNPISYFKFSIFIGIIIMMIAYLTSIYQNGIKTSSLGGFLFSLSFLSIIFYNIYNVFFLKITFYILLAFSFIFWIAFPEKVFSSRVPNVLWTFYSNTTGFVQDVLSHIRLFGISLSGAILAMVINRIGESFPIFILIPFSIVSHIIIFFLSLLSVYIHSNRLIFLEFGNKCIKGGHFFYKPLK